MKRWHHCPLCPSQHRDAHSAARHLKRLRPHYEVVTILRRSEIKADAGEFSFCVNYSFKGEKEEKFTSCFPEQPNLDLVAAGCQGEAEIIGLFIHSSAAAVVVHTKRERDQLHLTTKCMKLKQGIDLWLFTWCKLFTGISQFGINKVHFSTYESYLQPNKMSGKNVLWVSPCESSKGGGGWWCCT